jgi:TolB-like protein
VLLLAVGFPIALLLAWAFELTPEGVKRTASAEAAHNSAPKKLVALGVLIAVLPFVNFSSDAEQEYFSDGLSEELAKLDGLMVIARTSSFAFKGQNVDVRTIAATLGALRLTQRR